MQYVGVDFVPYSQEKQRVKLDEEGNKHIICRSLSCYHNVISSDEVQICDSFCICWHFANEDFIENVQAILTFANFSHFLINRSLTVAKLNHK